MTNQEIRKIALDNGFKLKDQPNGSKGLNPYVYDFARAIIAEECKQTLKEFPLPDSSNDERIELNDYIKLGLS